MNNADYDSIKGKCLIIDYNTIIHSDAILTAMILDKMKEDKDPRQEGTHPDYIVMSKFAYNRLERDKLNELFEYSEEELNEIYKKYLEVYNYEDFKSSSTELSKLMLGFSSMTKLVPKDTSTEAIAKDIKDNIADVKIILIDSPAIIMELCKIIDKFSDVYFIFPNYEYNKKFYEENRDELDDLSISHNFFYSVSDFNISL